MKTISANELKVALSKGKVEFTYVKQNGEARQATGTTNPSLIPSEYKSGVSSKPKTSVITYFDFGSMGWRNVSTTTSIAI
jgi:hypothetical protein